MPQDRNEVKSGDEVIKEMISSINELIDEKATGAGVRHTVILNPLTIVDLNTVKDFVSSFATRPEEMEMEETAPDTQG